jgi:hypothetical protein
MMAFLVACALAVSAVRRLAGIQLSPIGKHILCKIWALDLSAPITSNSGYHRANRAPAFNHC